MLVKTMEEKIDQLVRILEDGQFSMREIAKIAIAMELNAIVMVLEETLSLDSNKRFILTQIYKDEQDQLNKAK